MIHPIVVGNWKMHNNYAGSVLLAKEVARYSEKIKHIDIVLAPPSIFVYPIYESLRARPSNLYLGVQNMMWENEGAYTGEISSIMVRGIAEYVILGHSERAKFFGETNEQVNKKIKNCLKNHLNCIVCIGEYDKYDLEDDYERELTRMKSDKGILSGLKERLTGLSAEDLENVSIAYEPVWAIRTGNNASGMYAGAIASIIKEFLHKELGISSSCRVLYGGSVDDKNAREFAAQTSIDGLLVGGESLNALRFAKICKIVSEVKSGR